MTAIVLKKLCAGWGGGGVLLNYNGFDYLEITGAGAALLFKVAILRDKNRHFFSFFRRRTNYTLAARATDCGSVS